MSLNSSKMPPAACPVCRKVQDGATQIDNEPVAPKPGDFSLCIDCGAALSFNDDLHLVEVDLKAALNHDEISQEDYKRIECIQQRIRSRPRPQ